MTTEQQEHLEEVLSQPLRFRLSDYFSKAFDYFKKEAGLFIGFLLTWILISMVLSFVPIVGSMVNNLVVTPLLTVGIYIVAHRISMGELVSFDHFFGAKDRIMELALATFVVGVILLACLGPLLIDMASSGMLQAIAERMDGWYGDYEIDDFRLPTWGWISILLAIYASICLSWVLSFVYFYDMKATDAIQYSFRFIKHIWWSMLGFHVVSAFVVLLGVLCLLVGLFAAIPVVYMASFVAFADITKLDAFLGNQQPSMDTDYADLV